MTSPVRAVVTIYQHARPRVARWDPAVAIIVLGILLHVWGTYLGYRWFPWQDIDELANAANLVGLHGLYDSAPDFPATFQGTLPANPLLLLGLAAVHTAFRGPVDLFGAFVTKLPNIEADLGIAALTYAIAGRISSRYEALGAMAIAALAPWFVLPATMYSLTFTRLGEFDVPAAFFIMLALTLTLWKRYNAAWLALGAGSLFSWYALAAVPFVFGEQSRTHAFSRRTIASIVAIAGAWYLASAPFANTLDPAVALAWLARRYQIALQQGFGPQWFSVSSIWSSRAAYETWKSRPGDVFGIPADVAGLLATGAIFTYLLALVARFSSARTTPAQRWTALVTAWSIAYVALVVVAPSASFASYFYEMPVTTLLWVCGRWQRQVATATIVNWFATSYLMGELSKRGITPPERLEAVRLIAMLATTILLYALVAFGIDALRSAKPRIAADRLTPIRLP